MRADARSPGWQFVESPLWDLLQEAEIWIMPDLNVYKLPFLGHLHACTSQWGVGGKLEI